VGFDACQNLINCEVNDFNTTSTATNVELNGFRSCQRITNASIFALDSFNIVKGMFACTGVTNIKIEQIGITANNPVQAIGMHDCQNVSSFTIETIDSGTGESKALRNCDNVSSGSIMDLTGTEIRVVDGCEQLSGIIIDGVVSNNDADGFFQSNRLSSCEAKNISGVGEATGFKLCNIISSSRAKTIASSGQAADGFRTCNELSSCVADEIDGDDALPVRGFFSCLYMSVCRATDIDNAGAGGARGFDSCQYGSSLFTDEVSNVGNNFIDTADGGGVIAVDFSSNDNWT